MQPAYRIGLEKKGVVMKRLIFVLFAMSSSVWAAGVLPFLECVTYDTPTNSVTAFWGYTNANPTSTLIPIGPANFFDPPPGFRGQPVTFQSGVFHKVFSTTFRLAFSLSVTWGIQGHQETATNDPANYCAAGETSCWDTNGNGVCDLLTEDINGDGKCDALDCQGRQGLQGPAGPMGSPGQTGPAGPTGPPGISPSVNTVTVPTTTATATASCTLPQVLLNGGGACTVPNTNAINGRIASSAPSGSNGWTVTCSAGQATAVALCAAHQ
jgi:hypothetical protein